MNIKNQGFSLTNVLGAAVAALACGCGGGVDDVAEPNVETAQEALSYSSWATPPTFAAAAQYGPTFVQKNPGVFWGLVVPYDNTIQRNVYSNGSWLGWGGTGGSPTNVGSKIAATSWLGPGGTEDSKNVALAYVSSLDSKIRVAVAPTGQGIVGTWNAMTDVSVASPALAYANGYLYLFARRLSDNRLVYKRNPVTSRSYSFSNWSSTWASLGTEAVFGIGAAAVSSSTIGIVASRFDGSTTCRSLTLNVSSAGTVASSWASISGCSLSPYSIPAMVGTGPGGTSGARVVLFGSDGTLKTGTSSNGTSYALSQVPTNGCTPTSNPTVTQYTSSGLIALGTTCNGSENLSWRTLTP